MKRIAAFIRRVLPKDRFARSVSVLAGGTVASQVIVVLAAPVLTRLYNPQDLGSLAVFIALLSLLSVVACLRYEVAIPLPHEDSEAAELLAICIGAVLLVATAIGIPVILYRHAIAASLNTPALAEYLVLLPVGIFFVGIYNALNLWAVRTKAFTPLAKSKLSQSLTVVTIQLAGSPLGPAALMLGQVAGHAVASLSLALRILRHRWSLFREIKLQNVVSAAHDYKRAALFSTWSALFNAAGWQLPPILFALLFNPAAAGMYALAHRVLSMPMQLLGRAIGNVFFSNAAQARRDGSLAPLVASIHDRLAHIGMPPILVLVIAGPDIFSYVFGQNWREAGVIARWMAPWLYLVFITSPLSILFEVLDKQATGMAYMGVLLVVRAATIIGGAKVGDMMVAVSLFALGNTVFTLINLALVIRMSGNVWSEIWRPTLSALAWAIFLVSPIILTTMWDAGRIIWLFAFAAASLFIAARYAYLMRNAWL